MQPLPLQFHSGSWMKSESASSVARHPTSTILSILVQYNFIEGLGHLEGCRELHLPIERVAARAEKMTGGKIDPTSQIGRVFFDARTTLLSVIDILIQS